ncbi:MAG: hypothetical protein KAI81_01055 [Candidatus Marinimicrobia bacterium]|nr:hypothetical protein [Candidatus Neomarinimicrobiota bacterium]
MKRILILFILTTSVILAKSSTIILEFDKVNINNLYFDDCEEPRIEMLYGEAVFTKFTKRTYKFFIENNDTALINLFLPTDKKYLYNIIDKENNEKTQCIFSSEEMTLMQDNQAVIHVNNAEIIISDKDDDSQIKISDNSIQIIDKEDGDIIHIDDRGVIITNSDNTQMMTGFWGKMLGRMIVGTVSTVMEEVEERNGYESFIKDIINDDSDIKINIKD